MRAIVKRGCARGNRAWSIPLPGASTLVLSIALAAGPVHSLQAAQCPVLVEPNIPPSEQPATNIDKHKKQLLAYKNSKTYDKDIAAVMEGATRYVTERAAENRKLPAEQMKRLAIVLDIDETSLSNWANLEANNFGFIPGGTCFLEPGLPCGFSDWIDKGSATPIKPTLDFFKAARSKEVDVAVFFITGRRNSQRVVTMANLDRAGFQGWAGLATRPDDDHGSIVPFKTSEREKVTKNGYTIIANIGDQETDLVDKVGGMGDQFSECRIKLPNPFYFVD